MLNFFSKLWDIEQAKLDFFIEYWYVGVILFVIAIVASVVKGME